MERRNFLKGALAIFGAIAAGATLNAESAEAATPKLMPDVPKTPDTDELAAVESTDADGQYYYVRRRYRRPRRRVYYRRPRRRVYYYRRPRRVYYYRPRRVYYYRRPRYFW